MAKNYFWTDEQENILKTAYGIGGLDQASKALPHKPRGAIATKACRLKITDPKPRKTNQQQS